MHACILPDLLGLVIHLPSPQGYDDIAAIHLWVESSSVARASNLTIWLSTTSLYQYSGVTCQAGWSPVAGKNAANCTQTLAGTSFVSVVRPLGLSGSGADWLHIYEMRVVRAGKCAHCWLTCAW